MRTGIHYIGCLFWQVAKLSLSMAMATLSPVENDNGKVASYLRVSRKRFGSIALVGWSDSDSNFEKENDTKAINTKRLSLPFASDSKCFKGLKQNY